MAHTTWRRSACCELLPPDYFLARLVDNNAAVNDALAAIESVFSRYNVRAIRQELWPDEEILAAARASHAGLGLGVIAVTTTRLLFARTRFLRRPLIVSLALNELRNVRTERVLGSANLVVDDHYGRVFKFRSIRPPERALSLDDAVQQHSGDSTQPSKRPAR